MMIRSEWIYFESPMCTYISFLFLFDKFVRMDGPFGHVILLIILCCKIEISDRICFWVV